ncbi:hypothetical protein HY946_00770 [Candidatus Gottesmanbacteria bacterium]|nr:hypothetical protein [Candidatus Gottesmanbacteria bacterium]
MSIQTISTKELREDFSQVRAAMEAGQSLVLLYRSKPLAEIKPVQRPKTKIRLFSKRQIEQWIADDQLTTKEQKQIDAIIKNLS